MVALRASNLGIAKIKRARKIKGWNIDDYRWLEIASEFLGISWQEKGYFAYGISEGTWKRFLSGKYAINADGFKAFCQALELSWQDVIEGNLQQDWGEAIDVSQFFGREEEINTLKQWILKDKCRLISLLGMGGIGKTALSIKVSQSIQNQFDFVIWRSLRNTPTPEKILSELIQFLSEQKEGQLPQNTEDKVSLLLKYLRSHRCLLILDNIESILQPNNSFADPHDFSNHQYISGLQDYGELFKTISETKHQSCLLITSREKLPGSLKWEGDYVPVRCLPLKGLSQVAGKEIFAKKGNFKGSEYQWQIISDRYGGNPLALNIVASAIKDFFASDINSFLGILGQSPVIFNDIQNLLQQQFDRLSNLEKKIMYWLAIKREPLSFLKLKTNFINQVSPQSIIHGFTVLQSRSFVEKIESCFNQQTVIMEFVINDLIKHICREISTQEINLLNKVSLVQAQAKDYIRETQENAIAQPIIDSLLATYNSPQNLADHLKQILQLSQTKESLQRGYFAGNIINLLRQLNIDLTGWDFSDLTIRQANLQAINLHQVKFAHADLSQSVFTETLGNVLSAVFSNDGQLLATCDTDCQIRLWSVKTGKLLAICSGHRNWVRAIAFSHDSKILASGSADGNVKLWDTQDGTCIKTLIGHNDEVFAVAFTAGDKSVISGSADKTIKLWNIQTNECQHTLTGHKNCVRTVACHRRRNILASGSDDRTIRLWDITTGECLRIITAHESWIRTVAFSNDGITLASGSGDRTVKIWEVNHGRCLRTLAKHSQSIYSVATSNDGKLIASGSGDNTVRIWNYATGKCIRTLHGHTNQIISVAFSPDNQTLVCVSLDQTVKLWDIKTGNCWKTWHSHTDWARPIAYSTDGMTLASGNNDSTIKLWSYSQGKNISSLQGHRDLVHSLDFSPDGETLASSSTDCTVRIWDSSAGKCQQILSGHSDWIFAVKFIANSKIVVSGSADCTLKLWNYQTGKCLHTLKGHTNKILGVDFNAHANLIASASADRTIKLWDVDSKKCLQTLTGHSNRVYSVAFSPDGTTLVSGSTDKTIKLWDVYTGECLQTLIGHDNWVFAVAFSPDGNSIASASHDRTVRIWDVATGECRHICHGHNHLVSSVVFSPDGTNIASGSQDQTVRIWNVNTGECLQILRSARIYENMDITGVIGLTAAQKLTLKSLGAVSGQE